MVVAKVYHSFWKYKRVVKCSLALLLFLIITLLQLVKKKKSFQFLTFVFQKNKTKQYFLCFPNPSRGHILVLGGEWVLITTRALVLPTCSSWMGNVRQYRVQSSVCHITWRAATNAADKWAYHGPPVLWDDRHPPQPTPLAFTKTGGGRCETRCPSAAVVKTGPVAIQCRTMRGEEERCSSLRWIPGREGGGGCFTPRLSQWCPFGANLNSPRLW